MHAYVHAYVHACVAIGTRRAAEEGADSVHAPCAYPCACAMCMPTTHILSIDQVLAAETAADESVVKAAEAAAMAIFCRWKMPSKPLPPPGRAPRALAVHACTRAHLHTCTRAYTLPPPGRAPRALAVTSPEPSPTSPQPSAPSHGLSAPSHGPSAPSPLLTHWPLSPHPPHDLFMSSPSTSAALSSPPHFSSLAHWSSARAARWQAGGAVGWHLTHQPTYFTPYLLACSLTHSLTHARKLEALTILNVFAQPRHADKRLTPSTPGGVKQQRCEAEPGGPASLEMPPRSSRVQGTGYREMPPRSSTEPTTTSLATNLAGALAPVDISDTVKSSQAKPVQVSSSQLKSRHVPPGGDDEWSQLEALRRFHSDPNSDPNPNADPNLNAVPNDELSQLAALLRLANVPEAHAARLHEAGATVGTLLAGSKEELDETARSAGITLGMRMRLRRLSTPHA